jgi:thymidylate synthase
MNKLDKDYQALLQDILDNGVQKEDRTGTGTLSVFGREIRHKMSDGFPALTTKKFAFKTMITELLWFLRGDTNIKYLVDNNCHIWDGDAYKNFLKHSTPHDRQETMSEFINKIKTDDEFAKRWGDLGPVYGKQWRKWSPVAGEINKRGIDQIKILIKNIKENPDSRRLMVSAWNVGELGDMTLPPCHYGFQVYTRPTTREEKIVNPGKYRAISLKFDMRSVDTLLGMPFDIASYGALLHVIAKEVNMVPDELIAFFGDTHLYLNHLEQAREQISREPYSLPQLEIADDVVRKDGDCLPHYEPGDFKLIGYQSHPAIKAPLSN